jgi:hypothetical protein
MQNNYISFWITCITNNESNYWLYCTPALSLLCSTDITQQQLKATYISITGKCFLLIMECIWIYHGIYLQFMIMKIYYIHRNKSYNCDWSSNSNYIHKWCAIDSIACCKIFHKQIWTQTCLMQHFHKSEVSNKKLSPQTAYVHYL